MSLFHLEFAHANEQRPARYRVTARATDGEASGAFALPWSDSQLDRLLEKVPWEVLAPPGRTRLGISARGVNVERLGHGLFQALPPDVRSLLIAAMRDAEGTGSPLTVALRAQPPALVRLPWELLYIRERDDYPFVHHRLVRHRPSGTAGKSLRVPRELRVLAMIGHSHGVLSGRERELIEQALAPLTEAGHVLLEWVPGHRLRDLQTAIESADWHVVHFIGHGTFVPPGGGETDRPTGEGALLLEDDEGRPRPVSGLDLANQFRGQPSIRVVVLNSCHGATSDPRDRFSSVAEFLLDRAVPAVVAMQFEITDRAAIEFSRSFYSGLARQRSVEASVTAFRQDVRIALPGSLEFGTPVLYLDTPGRPVFDVWRPVRAATITAPAPVNAVAFSPNGRKLVLACDRRAPWLLPTGVWKGPRPAFTFATFGRTPYAVTFHPDAERAWFVTAHQDRMVRGWDSDSGAEMASARTRHPDLVSEVAFSPDGRWLATAAGDGVVRLYQDTTVRRSLPHPDSVRAVSFHGDQVATACDDGIARIWNLAEEAKEPREIRHGGPVIGVAFSPDGRLLATACDDGYARTWRTPLSDPESGRPVLVHEYPHGAGVLCVAFSPDGRRFATASRDHTTRIWDATIDEVEQLAIINHNDVVRRVAFSPDGHWLATASYDRTSQVWQLTKPASVEVWLDEQVSEGDATALQVAVRELRIAPGTLGYAVPARRSAGLDWLVVIVVPLTAFLAAIGTRAGNDAYDRLLRVIRTLREKYRTPDGEPRECRLQDSDTGRTIEIDPELPRGGLNGTDPASADPDETDPDNGEPGG